MRPYLVKLTAYTLFSIIILFAVLLVMEIVFRAIPGYEREWMDYNTNTVWQVKANNKAAKRTKEHPDFLQTTNREGFNDVDHKVGKQKGVKRIMIIGDSYTAGLDYPVEETFAGIIQRQLSAKFPGEYEVMNCSTPAWSAEQEFLYFLRQGKEYKPDYVLLVVAPNDVREGYTRNLLQVHNDTVETWLNNPMSKKEKLVWKLSTNSSSAVWLQKNRLLPRVTFENMLWKYFSRGFSDASPDSGWDLPLFLIQPSAEVAKARQRFSAVLGAFNTHCNEINARLLVSVIPTKEEFGEVVSDRIAYQPGRIAYWLDTICGQQNIPFQQTFDEAANLKNTSELYQSWEYHFDPDGHVFMADLLSDFLEKETRNK